MPKNKELRIRPTRINEKEAGTETVEEAVEGSATTQAVEEAVEGSATT